jgi:hypothetical protein
MIHPTGDVGEREIPEEIQKWIWEAGTGYAKGLDSEYRERAEEDFENGATTMYHKMYPHFKDFEDSANIHLKQQFAIVQALEQKINAHVRRNQELEKENADLRAKIQELQEWHDSHI